MPKEQSSEELSSLAGKVLKMQPAPKDKKVSSESFNILLGLAKRLAGSVLSQDETPLEDIIAETGEASFPDGGE